MTWPEGTPYRSLYEMLQSEYPVLSDTPGTFETVETDDSWMEESVKLNIW